MWRWYFRALNAEEEKEYLRNELDSRMTDMHYETEKKYMESMRAERLGWPPEAKAKYKHFTHTLACGAFAGCMADDPEPGRMVRSRAA